LQKGYDGRSATGRFGERLSRGGLAPTREDTPNDVSRREGDTYGDERALTHSLDELFVDSAQLIGRLDERPQ
jgi:hypothetical protein